MKRVTTICFVSLCLLVAIAEGADKRVLIEFDRVDDDAERRVREVNGKVVHIFPEYRVISAWMSEAAIQQMKTDLRVKRIEPDPERRLMAERIPYGIPMVQANQVSDEFAGNRKVCIIDSGFQKSHDDLQDTQLTGTSLLRLENPFEDRCGHGTHVAGIISALDNEIGVVGILPGNRIRLHIVKIFDDDCNMKSSYASDLVSAIRKCRAVGAHVINMSLGGEDPSNAERQALDDAYDAGILSVAAAGNAGDTSYLYPASYDSVISVAAVTSTQKIASFSQANDKVELAAPGMGVLSTVPYVETNTVTIDEKTYRGNSLEHAGRSKGVTGTLVDGKLCKTFIPSWKGKVVLCRRGEIFFSEKVRNVQRAGGIATIIYNNVPGNFRGTLGDGFWGAIPAISLSKATGEFLLKNKLKKAAKVVSQRKEPASGYEKMSGTSMSTPHVAGLAALIWSYGPQWTNTQIREALRVTARDLGPVGKDDSYGYGLPQAKAALEWLQAQD